MRHSPTFLVEKLAELKVYVTEYLRSQYDDEGADLVRAFADWKSMGPDGEYHHYYFGKDGEYARPLVNGKKVLRHVHFVPGNDSPYKPQWDKVWGRKGRKTSDDVVIYAQGAPCYGTLLIAVIIEPQGHNFAEMQTQEDEALMEGFASAADQFIFDGSIIV